MNKPKDERQSHRDKPPREERPVPYDPREDEERRRRHQKAVEGAMQDYWRRHWKEHPHDTPWLLIRYGDGDLGVRPVPAGTATWLSPDIWIESSDPNGNGVAGEENHVWVRVFNLGRYTAAPVKLDYFWANPALGLGAANMNPIGTEWVEVKSQFSREVRCTRPWIPVLVNGGHECLKVNCTCPTLDPITVPFDPRLDRHVGQRNVTVVAGPPGAMLGFRLELNNILAVASHTMVFAQAAHVAFDRGWRRGHTRMELVNRLAAIGNRVIHPVEMQARAAEGTPTARAAQMARPRAADLEGGTRAFRILNSAPRIGSTISHARMRFHPSTGQRALAARLLGGSGLLYDDAGPRPQLQRLEEITLEGHESRHLELELQVPAGARPGDHVVFQFEQWTGALNLGGYAVIVEVNEDVENQGKR